MEEEVELVGKKMEEGDEEKEDEEEEVDGVVLVRISGSGA